MTALTAFKVGFYIGAGGVFGAAAALVVILGVGYLILTKENE